VKSSQPPSPEAQEAQMLILASLAGLDIAVQDFREDVLTAARTAMKVQQSFAGPSSNTIEPWPPMQVKP
jgi:hypothetical protein